MTASFHPYIAVTLTGGIVFYRPTSPSVSPTPKVSGTIYQHVLHRRQFRQLC